MAELIYPGEKTVTLLSWAVLSTQILQVAKKAKKIMERGNLSKAQNLLDDVSLAIPEEVSCRILDLANFSRLSKVLQT